jgi:hypothetical protein
VGILLADNIDNLWDGVVPVLIDEALGPHVEGLKYRL